MDRKNYYYGQLVTEGDLDGGFTDVDSAFKNLNVDHALYGIVSGLAASAGAGATLDVAKGVAYDQLGRRINAYSDGVATKNHSYATATDGTATSVSSGNERWISIYAKWGQKRTTPYTDGNGASGYFDLDDVINSDGTDVGVDKLYIVKGVEAASGAGVKPALASDAILICDVKRTFNDVSNVVDTTRRQNLFVISGSPKSLNVNTIPAALTALLGYRNELAGTGAGTDGAQFIGAQAGTALSSGTVRSQLDALDARTHMTGALTYLGGRSFPAADPIQTLFSTLLADLGAQTASDDGAERIGAQASGGMSAGSVRSQLDYLNTNKVGSNIANTFTAIQTFSPATYDVPAFEMTHRVKQLIARVQTSGGNLRVYFDGADFTITRNAVYSTGTSQWTKDDNTEKAAKLTLAKDKLRLEFAPTGAVANMWDEALTDRYNRIDFEAGASDKGRIRYLADGSRVLEHTTGFFQNVNFGYYHPPATSTTVGAFVEFPLPFASAPSAGTVTYGEESGWSGAISALTVSADNKGFRWSRNTSGTAYFSGVVTFTA